MDRTEAHQQHLNQASAAYYLINGVIEPQEQPPGADPGYNGSEGGMQSSLRYKYFVAQHPLHPVQELRPVLDWGGDGQPPPFSQLNQAQNTAIEVEVGKDPNHSKYTRDGLDNHGWDDAAIEPDSQYDPERVEAHLDGELHGPNGKEPGTQSDSEQD